MYDDPESCPLNVTSAVTDIFIYLPLDGYKMSTGYIQLKTKQIFDRALEGHLYPQLTTLEKTSYFLKVNANQ